MVIVKSTLKEFLYSIHMNSDIHIYTLYAPTHDISPALYTSYAKSSVADILDSLSTKELEKEVWIQHGQNGHFRIYTSEPSELDLTSNGSAWSFGFNTHNGFGVNGDYAA